MRTETKTIKIYNFDELPKDIQKRLIEEAREFLQENEYTEDGEIY